MTLPLTAQQRLAARALELIEKGWTRHALARTPRGWATSPTSDDAARFCASGSVLRACHELRIPYAPDGSHLEKRLKDELNAARGDGCRYGLMFINDRVLKSKTPLVKALRKLSTP